MESDLASILTCSYLFSNPYASALLYADLTQNGGQYSNQIGGEPDLEAVNKYVDDKGTKNWEALDFTVYIPMGYDNLSGKMVPNTEITDDPSKIFTASFASGNEIWPESRL